jgi:hypothetical protein
VGQAIPEDRCTQTPRKTQARLVPAAVVALPTEIRQETRGVRGVGQMGERAGKGSPDRIGHRLCPAESRLARGATSRSGPQQRLDGHGLGQAPQDREGRRLRCRGLADGRPDRRPG